MFGKSYMFKKKNGFKKVSALTMTWLIIVIMLMDAPLAFAAALLPEPDSVYDAVIDDYIQQEAKEQDVYYYEDEFNFEYDTQDMTYDALHDGDGMAYHTDALPVWGASSAVAFFDASAITDWVYIGTAAELSGFLAGEGSNADNFRLTADITLPAGRVLGRPGIFTGVFYGAGYTITGLNLRGGASAGFVQTAGNGAVIANVNFAGGGHGTGATNTDATSIFLDRAAGGAAGASLTSANGRAGIVIGTVAAGANVLISDVNITGHAAMRVDRGNVNNSSIGGFVGVVGTIATLTLRNISASNLDIQQIDGRSTNVGGVVGLVEGTVNVQNANLNVNIRSTNAAGTGALNTGANNPENAGGVIGFSNGNVFIEDVRVRPAEGTSGLQENRRVIIGRSHVGGFVGRAASGELAIRNSENLFSAVIANDAYNNVRRVSATQAGSRLGGIIGSTGAATILENVRNYGAVYVAQDNLNTLNIAGVQLAGIVGRAESTISMTNVHNRGRVEHGHRVANTWAAGVIAHSGTLVANDVSNTGPVRTSSNAGIRNGQHNRVGGIVAVVSHLTTIENAVNYASAVINHTGAGEGTQMAGIVARVAAQFTGENLINHALIHTGAHVGTVGAPGYATISTTRENWWVNLTQGGIIGAAAGATTLDNVTNHGRVHNRSHYHSVNNIIWIGGILGTNTAALTINTALNTGDVTNEAGGTSSNNGREGSFGGIVGATRAMANINDVENTGNITPVAARHHGNIGGIVGHVRTGVTTIDGAINHGNVNGRRDVGGIVGTSTAAGTVIRNAFNHGNVTQQGAANASAFGGIIGRAGGANILIEDSANFGAIASNTTTGSGSGSVVVSTAANRRRSGIGGIMGSNQNGGTVRRTFNAGHITGGHRTIAGIIGTTGSVLVQDVFNVGPVVALSDRANSGSGILTRYNGTVVIERAYVAGFQSGFAVARNNNNLNSAASDLNPSGIVARNVYVCVASSRSTAVSAHHQNGNMGGVVALDDARMLASDALPGLNAAPWLTGFVAPPSDSISTLPYLSWQSGGTLLPHFFTAIAPQLGASAPATPAYTGVTGVGVTIFNPYNNTVAGWRPAYPATPALPTRPQLALGLMNAGGVIGVDVLPPPWDFIVIPVHEDDLLPVSHAEFTPNNITQIWANIPGSFFASSEDLEYYTGTELVVDTTPPANYSWVRIEAPGYYPVYRLITENCEDLVRIYVPMRPRALDIIVRVVNDDTDALLAAARLLDGARTSVYMTGASHPQLDAGRFAVSNVLIGDVFTANAPGFSFYTFAIATSMFELGPDSRPLVVTENSVDYFVMQVALTDIRLQSPLPVYVWALGEAMPGSDDEDFIGEDRVPVPLADLSGFDITLSDATNFGPPTMTRIAGDNTLALANATQETRFSIDGTAAEWSRYPEAYNVVIFTMIQEEFDDEGELIGRWIDVYLRRISTVEVVVYEIRELDNFELARRVYYVERDAIQEGHFITAGVHAAHRLLEGAGYLDATEQVALSTPWQDDIEFTFYYELTGITITIIERREDDGYVLDTREIHRERDEFVGDVYYVTAGTHPMHAVIANATNPNPRPIALPPYGVTEIDIVFEYHRTGVEITVLYVREVGNVLLGSRAFVVDRNLHTTYDVYATLDIDFHSLIARADNISPRAITLPALGVDTYEVTFYFEHVSADVPQSLLIRFFDVDYPDVPFEVRPVVLPAPGAYFYAIQEVLAHVNNAEHVRNPLGNIGDARLRSPNYPATSDDWQPMICPVDMRSVRFDNVAEGYTIDVFYQMQATPAVITIHHELDGAIAITEVSDVIVGDIHNIVPYAGFSHHVFEGLRLPDGSLITPHDAPQVVIEAGMTVYMVYTPQQVLYDYNYYRVNHFVRIEMGGVSYELLVGYDDVHYSQVAVAAATAGGGYLAPDATPIDVEDEDTEQDAEHTEDDAKSDADYDYAFEYETCEDYDYKYEYDYDCSNESAEYAEESRAFFAPVMPQAVAHGMVLPAWAGINVAQILNATAEYVAPQAEYIAPVPSSIAFAAELFLHAQYEGWIATTEASHNVELITDIADIDWTAPGSRIINLLYCADMVTVFVNYMYDTYMLDSIAISMRSGTLFEPTIRGFALPPGIGSNTGDTYLPLLFASGGAPAVVTRGAVNVFELFYAVDVAFMDAPIPVYFQGIISPDSPIGSRVPLGLIDVDEETFSIILPANYWRVYVNGVDSADGVYMLINPSVHSIINAVRCSKDIVVAFGFFDLHYVATFAPGTGATIPGLTTGQNQTQYVLANTAVSAVPTPIRPGYTFAGWTPDVTLPVTGNITFVAGWTPDLITTSPAPSSPLPIAPPVRPVTQMPLVQPVVDYEEYQEDHGVYRLHFMQGFETGLFMPYSNLTRAQAAGLLARTMLGTIGMSTPQATVDITGVFSDVTNPNRWYYNYIALAYQYGLSEGFPDGTFRPHQPITRQELAAMMTRTTTAMQGGALPYTDAEETSAWAFDYVYTMLQLGWMHGDSTGTFRPGDDITRAEAAALISRALGRGQTVAQSIEGIRHQVRIFPDVTNDSRWYFFYVVEATNTHRYVLRDGVETWVSVRW